MTHNSTIKFNKRKIELKHKAKDYQIAAIDKIKNLNYAALFFEQGLGKTKISIDLIKYWLENNLTENVIVFTKKTLVENWKKEFAIHSDIIPAILGRDKVEDSHTIHSKKQVYITHFEALKSEYDFFEFLSNTRRIAIILDESVKIKNPEASITKYFIEYGRKAVKKIILTGTPVANRPQDLWSQVYFLDYGQSLGENYKAFMKSVDIPKNLVTSDALQLYSSRLLEIFPKLRGFCFRETKVSTQLSLPDMNIIKVFCSWNDEQRQLYHNVISEIGIEMIRDGMSDTDISENLVKKLLRLVQLSSNPVILNETYGHTVDKYNKLKQIINEAVKKREKVIVWSSFISNVKWLHNILKKEYGTVSLHGGHTIALRNKNIEKFINDDQISILVANPGAAKEGLTLTCANHAVYFDRNFILDDYLQSMARIHRISQTKECYVYNLLLENSIDVWIDEYLFMKELAAKLSQGDISQDEFSENFPTEMKNKLMDLLNHHY